MTKKNNPSLTEQGVVELAAKAGGGDRSSAEVRRIMDYLGLKAVKTLKPSEVAYRLDRIADEKSLRPEVIALAARMRKKLGRVPALVIRPYTPSPRRYPLVTHEEAWTLTDETARRTGRNNELLRLEDAELVDLFVDAIGQGTWSMQTLRAHDRILCAEIQRRGGLAWLRPLLAKGVKARYIGKNKR